MGGDRAQVSISGTGGGTGVLTIKRDYLIRYDVPVLSDKLTSLFNFKLTARVSKHSRMVNCLTNTRSPPSGKGSEI